jgi:hypothetical protein
MQNQKDPLVKIGLIDDHILLRDSLAGVCQKPSGDKNSHSDHV